jgi:purine-cytosine permease-like protein
MAEEGETIEKEVLFGFLPVLRHERVYGTWDYIALQICYGIAAWAFLVGSFTGYVLPAKEAVPAIFLGEAIPLGIMAFYAILFARYGVDQFLLPRAALGYHGNTLLLLIWIPINWGWIAYASFLFGEAMIKILAAIHAPLPAFFMTEAGYASGASFWAVIAFILGLIPAYLGPFAVRWVTRIAAPAMTLVLLGLIYYIIAVYGLENLYALPAVDPYENPLLNRAFAVEWNAGLGFAWAFYYGQWSRIAKSETAAYHGPYWGWGPIMCVAVIFASFTMLVTKNLDPTAWMIQVGGPSWGLMGLILMAVANITSNTLLIYTQAIPVKYTWPKIKWITAVLTAVPAVVLFNVKVFEHYNVFLTLVGCLWTIYPAILLADFFVIRRGKFDLRDLYYKKSKYMYWHGFNIPAMLMFPIGYIFYFAMVDPWNATTEGALIPIFQYTTGLIPTFVLIFVLYTLIMKATMKRA